MKLQNASDVVKFLEAHISIGATASCSSRQREVTRNFWQWVRRTLIGGIDGIVSACQEFGSCMLFTANVMEKISWYVTIHVSVLHVWIVVHTYVKTGSMWVHENQLPSSPKVLLSDL